MTMGRYLEVSIFKCQIRITKEIGDEEHQKSILSFIWAGLAALRKARYSIMKVVQS